MDTDIDNYTIEELLTILNLDDEPNQHQIITATNDLEDKYDNEGNSELANFFAEAQNKLMDHFYEGDTPAYNTSDPPAQDVWYKNEQIPQPNTQQADKITDRRQQVGFVNTPSGTVMNRNQLGVNQNFELPVAQGTINPNLKNTTVRIVNVDSSFRNNENDSSTNYSAPLSEPINNVIKIELYSINIPLSWYNISSVNGTNCFMIMDNTNQIEYYVNIDSGNYEIDKLIDTINNYPLENGNTVSSFITFSYNSTNGKITMTVGKNKYVQIVFYNENNNVCKKNLLDEACPYSPKSNYSLGWFLGFRKDEYYLTAGDDEYSNFQLAEGVFNISGTKNLYIVLDDYNQNRINKGLISITELDTSLSLPSYYQGDMDYSCIQTQTNEAVQFQPGAPRKITQAQLYSINEIIKNRRNRTNTKTSAPTTTDVFAVIPVEREPTKSFGFQMVEFGGSLLQNQRQYFGPVNIDRVGVKLVDDNGLEVDLNGNDWCFSFLCESLYQY